jgi:hypothetical protein
MLRRGRGLLAPIVFATMYIVASIQGDQMLFVERSSTIERYCHPPLQIWKRLSTLHGQARAIFSDIFSQTIFSDNFLIFKLRSSTEQMLFVKKSPKM